MISIVILNYFEEDKTINLLRSLKDQIGDNTVVVVDNGSHYASVEIFLENNFPLHIYLRPGHNLGFGGGVNLGIKKSLEEKADWIMLLNNDATAPADLISSLSPITTSSQGIIGLPVIESDGRIAKWGNIQWLRHTLAHEYGDTKPTHLSYAIGGAMLIHKSVFDKIGFLDDNYFLYFEDADFSSRARKAGIRIDFPKLNPIEHEVSGTSKKLGSPLLLRYHYRNSLYFNYKNGPLFIKLLIWLLSVFIILKQAIKITLSIKKDASRAIFRGVLDFYLNRLGQIN